MSDLLDGITVVLYGTRFPENVGMAARACANMGVSKLCLVAPEMWNREKALPLATLKGRPLLDNMDIFSSLADALGGHGLVVGTTARTGGWRQNILSPRAQAPKILETLASGSSVAILFGPEDRGLTNEEIMLCHEVTTIPTSGESSSINLAQSVLLVLYECFMAHASAGRPTSPMPAKSSLSPALPLLPAALVNAAADVGNAQSMGGEGASALAGGVAPASGEGAGQVNQADYERLMASFKNALLHIDFLHGDNPDYFFMPLRRFFARKGLKRHEYDAFMGMCRQILRMRPPQ